MEEQIRRCLKDILHYPLYSHGLIETPKTLTDMVETVIRAIYEDIKQSLNKV